MKPLRRLALLAVALVPLTAVAQERDPTRVFSDDHKPADARLGKPRTLNDYFPMTVPASKEAWEVRRQQLREQILVALGLWPMPPKTPLKPVIHGRIQRDGYTVEKVYCASLPGFYLTGNLYRPSGGKQGQKFPGVLCPHGHWRNGRFFEAGDNEVKNQQAGGGESTAEGARYPLQARCAQLARMGCVVFHYDMVGNADSRQIGHAAGFKDADAELRLQSAMGLQSWNSIRALDFLMSLPDVDSKRIGVTGASGGGTQTFILCAIDDRPTVAVPAVMVSTGMQGGCVCENASYLRQGAGNVDFAALFAPRPLALIGADDWTIEIEKKGLPELKALYKLLGAENRVAGKCFPQFKHNYNQVSREYMYEWFNTHLKLGHPSPIKEAAFTPLPPKELSVWNEQHPLPKDARDAKGVREYLSQVDEDWRSRLIPTDERSLAEFRRVMGTALRVMIGGKLPAPEAIEVKEVGTASADGATFRRLILGRKGAGEQMPAIEVRGKDFNGTIVVWVHPRGKASLMHDGKLIPAARQILQAKAGILAIDALQTGEQRTEKPREVNKTYAGYTYGYNRPLLAERVHDILTAVAFARGGKDTKTVHLAGFDSAGPWAALARSLCGDAVAKTIVDFHGFRFDRVREIDDEMMLPGALKYGGLGALVALSAPGELHVHQQRGTGTGQWLKAAYKAAKAPNKLHESPARLTAEESIAWLLK